MTALVPREDRYTASAREYLAIRWTETDGRTALAERCQDRCEGCGGQWHGQAAHRLRKGQGGLWSPANLLALCGSGTTGCHGWAHARPLLAQGLGWEVLPQFEPHSCAAYLVDPYNPVSAGWRLLIVEAEPATGVRRHLSVPVEPRWVP